MLFELLSDIVTIENLLFVVKSEGATSEIRSPLSIKQREKWITLGENDDPAHMHVNSELISHAKFVQEEKPERTSFSVRFYNKDNQRVLAAFFTKMYDDSKTLIPERKKMYDELNEKYSSKINF
ncbi:heme utilization ChuX/HutX protein [Marine Group I thaumarchaeote SCGC AAA799-B03]|uniref:Heme utilization ChuX/HutX protein n=4 Tax=Marine Group I TaxID=905826 RepID=A0A087S800_9ARCH|nr:heme utilization ChuX/HutX protein [Marine Group I thaumarchaeote SCGC AAA799-N04]KFM17038.1 heme utilization ChuX/HutX protein [Marine Group I thaumarchaeote SCGC AAA799-D11]KFM19140.1 heme utilization ChuX/HutX protein [Marine Group I thaumarchaeote SCGC RSA3]KFM21854.1 heme utilization ChuX/HutX protein [Marine Group I thaumarchaeote SCGC AAA799-B03]